MKVLVINPVGTIVLLFVILIALILVSDGGGKPPYAH